MTQMTAFIAGILWATVIGVPAANNEPRFLLGMAALAATVATVVLAVQFP